jgi:formylglycine-generating enzyme required for sulfatase activity
LEEGEQSFGGYDGVVLWHAYPRLGFDDRNQFDLYRDMPGGLAGLRELARVFHSRGVRVFIDYNPWDTGTRREGSPDVDVLTQLVSAIDADGIFLDTMKKGPPELRAKLDGLRPGLTFETEGGVPLEDMATHHMSWAQTSWDQVFRDSQVPGILRNKWIERGHMKHVIDRIARTHIPEIHWAWMNGSGILIWENVFGTWIEMSARDRSILRSMFPILHRYVRLFSGERWTPLVETVAPDTYASLWEGAGLRLWTVTNASENTIEGDILQVPEHRGHRYFDLIAGQQVDVEFRQGLVTLRGKIRPWGVGAFLSGANEVLGTDFRAFLDRQAAVDAVADWNPASPIRPEVLRPVERTRKYTRTKLPEGMVAIEADTFDMEVVFRKRECGTYQTPLRRRVSLPPYAIDVTPVTNAQFAKFIAATGYRPRFSENFLKHWRNGAPLPGLEDHPVVHVDLQDARAYAKWAGKRLPAEEEWQYVAQGPDKRLYPWGNEMRSDACNGGEKGGTTPVRAFPGGRSPFGCYDMCGNTWEWTESERRDERTHFAILKGGSFYRPVVYPGEGYKWYADGGAQACNFAAKFLLVWPGLDRCATIGFRCVVDLDG